MKSPRFLEYIEMNGQQYIDTGIHIYGWGDGIDMRACITNPSSNYDTFFGCRRGNGGRFTARYGNSASGELQMQLSTGNSYSTNYEYWNTGIRKNVDTGWISLHLEGLVQADPKSYGYGSVRYHLDGEYKSANHAFNDTAIGTEYPTTLYLGALHDEDQGPIDFAYMRLASCTIYGYDTAHRYIDDEGVNTRLPKAVRVFFPALDENGRACLYDAIDDEYFYSPNGQEFIAGPEINQMLFRIFSRDVGYTPEYHLRNVTEVLLPSSGFIPTPGYNHPENRIYDVPYEFVGYDTDPEAFTPVYGKDGTSLGTNLKNHILDVCAVWKRTYGYLVKDGNGVFYTKDYTGARVNLGQKELCAKTFGDYAFKGYPGADILTDLFSPSVYNWTKQIESVEEGQIYYKAPAIFDITVRAIPPLPQLIVYPTVILRKPVAYVTIPSDDETLWNVSFDGGSTWYKYEGDWVAVSAEGDGCLKRKFEILDNDDWTPKITNNTLKFRAWLRKDAWVSSVRIHYMEGE